MFKKLTAISLFVLASASLSAQTTVQKSLYKIVTDTYETKADSMTNAFIETYMVKSKGYFNVSYNNYAFNAYWTQAHYIDVVIYNYQRHKGIDLTLANKYLNYIKLWFTNKANNYAGASVGSTPAYKMFENPYTDDMCWIALTLLHITEATGLSTYASAAKGVFDNYIIKRGLEDEETGGIKLPWAYDNEANKTKFNACTQSPATLIAAKLYQKYGDEKYLDYAKKLYAYTIKKIVKFDASKNDYRVEEPPLSYTQGTFAEACRILYHVTDESTTIKNKYKNYAYQILNYAFTSNRTTNGSGILRSEGSSGDQSVFKAVLIPYAVNFVLDESMTSTQRQTVCRQILKNSTTMWKNLDLSAYPKVFCNFDWTKTIAFDSTTGSGSTGAMCSGSSLIENSARMCRVISDRYNLGTLVTECNTLQIDSVQATDPELATYIKALDRAKEIMAAPGNFTISDYKKAITNLSAAYPTAKEYLATIDAINLIPVDREPNTYGVYTLGGRLVRTPWQRTDDLPAGIYIINGKKVVK